VADLREAGDVARAVRGVEAVLVVNPMLPQAVDAAAEMRGTIEAIATGGRIQSSSRGLGQGAT